MHIIKRKQKATVEPLAIGKTLAFNYYCIRLFDSILGQLLMYCHSLVSKPFSIQEKTDSRYVSFLCVWHDVGN